MPSAMRYRGRPAGLLRGVRREQVWLYRLVQALRQHDTRWGLNWKRGNRGDMSQDVVTYNFSADADEGTTNVYIIDVIVGHCGCNPQAAWIDNTEATRQAGTIGRWTLQPYIAAGGISVSGGKWLTKVGGGSQLADEQVAVPLVTGRAQAP